MIQELLSGVVEAERKISSFSSPSRSATSSPTSSSDPQKQQQQQQQQQKNLRCPRCDSSNTKFCYYNNYNLTQPRHFCKTCRRYWTKGGALRNVPIGGGCRRAKSIAPTVSSAAGVKSGGGSKAKPVAPLTSIDDVMGRAATAAAGLAGGLDHGCPDLLPSCSPILWPGMPHGSHLLALLRASQMQNLNLNPNPNPNATILNSMTFKEAQTLAAEGNGAVNVAHNLSLDHHLGQYYHHQQAQQNLLLNDMPTSSGIQELYQRLRSPSTTTASSFCNGNDNLHVVASNAGSGGHCTSSVANATAAASIFEPIPSSAADTGYGWSPAMMWPDLSATTYGAFP